MTSVPAILDTYAPLNYSIQSFFFYECAQYTTPPRHLSDLPTSLITASPRLPPSFLGSHKKNFSSQSLSLSPHIKLIPEHLDKYLLLTYYLYTYVLIIYCSCSYISEFHLIKWKNCTQLHVYFWDVFSKTIDNHIRQTKKNVSQNI